MKSSLALLRRERGNVSKKTVYEILNSFVREGLASVVTDGGEPYRYEARTAPHRDASGVARAARGMLTQRDARVINSLPEIMVP